MCRNFTHFRKPAKHFQTFIHTIANNISNNLLKQPMMQCSLCNIFKKLIYTGRWERKKKYQESQNDDSLSSTLTPSHVKYISHNQICSERQCTARCNTCLSVAKQNQDLIG